MPQWQTTNLGEEEVEGGRTGGTGRGGQGREDRGKKETDEMDGETAACVKEDTREEEGKGKKRPGETLVYHFAGETL